MGPACRLVEAAGRGHESLGIRSARPVGVEIVAPDRNYVVQAKAPAVIGVAPGREPPRWASPGAINCRGLVDPGSRHYLALITVDGAVVEGIVDTGACRTMMDLRTAKALGVQLEELGRGADGKFPFGHFYGPEGVPAPYAGRTKGPVTFRFSSEVQLVLPEVKLVDNPGPLLLLGNDLLGPYRRGWSFLSVGYHKVTG